jgi:hypothetical protein
MPGNDKIKIEYCAIELFWKPLGGLAKFVLVRHPGKGNSIPMSTDLTLDPVDLRDPLKFRLYHDQTILKIA